MALAQASTILPYLLGLLALFTAYIAFNHLRLSLYRRHLSRSSSCKPPVRADSSDWLPLGIQFTSRTLSADKEHKLPQFFQSIFKQHGNTWLCTQHNATIVTTCEPRIIQAILATQFKDFDVGTTRYSAFHPLLGDSILNIDDESWKYARSALRPQFAKDQISQFSRLDKHIARALEIIFPPSSPSVNVVNFSEIAQAFAADSATEFLFGEAQGELLRHGRAKNSGEMGLAEAFAYAADISALRETMGDPMAWLMSGRDWTKYYKACNICHDILDEYIDAALSRDQRQTEPKKYDFLQEIIRETSDKRFARDQALSLLFAARETTAITLGWIFYELARNPGVFRKLREEVVQTFADEEPSFDKLHELTYLRYVLQETLRLYPPVPLNSRSARRDTVLPIGGGPDGNSPLLIKKGWIVQYLVFSMHRRKDLFGEDADVFRPERWGDDPRLRAVGFGYLPFNGGPRICLGQKKAQTEISYIVARLLMNITSVNTAPGKPEQVKLEDMRFRMGITLGPADGVWVQLKKD